MLLLSFIRLYCNCWITFGIRVLKSPLSNIFHYLGHLERAHNIFNSVGSSGVKIMRDANCSTLSIPLALLSSKFVMN